MPIDFYFSKLSPPARVAHIGLKQFKLDVNYKPLDLKNGEHKTPEFLKLIASLQLWMVIWRSGAILQYLANKYAPNSTLYPSDPNKREIVDRTLNFDISYITSIKHVILLPFFRGTVPTEQQTTNMKNNLKLMDTLIGNDLTIADISVLISTSILEINDLKNLNDFPNLKGWYQRLKNELPYFEEVNGNIKEDFLGYILSQKK